MITNQIRKLLAELDEQCAKAETLKKALAALELRAGQQNASVHVCGVNIELSYLSERTGYSPCLHPERRALHACLVLALKDSLSMANSAVEGVEFKIRNAARSTP